MKRAASESFILRAPLRTDGRSCKELGNRFFAGTKLRNACLGEALKRLNRLRQSPSWREAKEIKDKKLRSTRLKELNHQFGFTYGSLQKFAEATRDACWIGHHLGSHDTQAISLRVFQAVWEYLLGKRGRPRFQRRIHSIEGKSNEAVIRFRQDKGPPTIYWNGLELPLMLDPRDAHGWQKAALARKTKYCRIIECRKRGKFRYEAQLIQEGQSPQKENHPLGEGTVGLDLGPSTIAMVGDSTAFLEEFCPTVLKQDAEVRKLQRAMDRSLRATNPSCYDPKTHKLIPGKRLLNRSRRYRKLQEEKADRDRCKREERKRSHGELANRILSQGRNFKLERVSYKGWQKCFGRSIGCRAPGMFVSLLRRKAEGAGGKVFEFSTWKTRLSQYDHKTGTYVKKPLSQRFHPFPDGTTVQRDLYSAWLAIHVENDTLNSSQLDDSWAAAEPLLRQAELKWKQSAKERASAFSAPKKRQSGSSVKEDVQQYEAAAS